MSDDTQHGPSNRATKLLVDLFAKHGDANAALSEFEERVRNDPSLGSDVVAPTLARLVKAELMKLGRLPH
jgi:hypothetical protein